MNVVRLHDRLAFVNLLDEIILHYPRDHENEHVLLYPHIGYRTEVPLTMMYPGVYHGITAENNGRWATAIWDWFSSTYDDVPVSFEFNTVMPLSSRGYSARLVRLYADWIYRYMPGLDAASLEFYVAVGNQYTDTDDYLEIGQELADAYFESLLYQNTAMPLWVDEFGLEVCIPGDPQHQSRCYGREFSTDNETDQTMFINGILSATQSRPQRNVLGRVLWVGGWDGPGGTMGEPNFGIFHGYDRSVDPAGYPLLKTNFEALFALYFDPPPDSDSDGVVDPQDNCIDHANADQRDTDGDGHGNLCDADFNGDCIVNAVDLGSFRTAFFSAADDQGLNGDGIVNAIDLGLFKSLYFTVPGPSPAGALCEP